MKQIINPRRKFNIDLVDQIIFLDYFYGKEKSCESWTKNCGCCGNFNFFILNNEIRFFYLESPILGYHQTNKSDLVILFHPEKILNDFLCTGKFDFEIKYPIPKTMGMFVKYIEDYMQKCYLEFVDMMIDHHIEFREEDDIDLDDISDLPF